MKKIPMLEKFAAQSLVESDGELVFSKERFAELIVKECIEQGNTLANHYINTHPEQEQVMLLASIADYSNEIKKHFGVEQ